ncbi:uncharacterized protein LOC142170472 [Nicotiana tabacum]|uniref:Uncharacterized protein LOC142170472 n=1 Tax=Nicotiana tabacum TaxID=4097 RepID=A0AC58SU43_TOBAC
MDIHPPHDPTVGNRAMVLIPTLRGNSNPTRGILENDHNPTPNVDMFNPTNFIIWNIRGGNNEDFRRNFRDLVDTHRPCMVALLETRMQSHALLLNEFEFSELIEVPTVGQARGMVLLWDHTKVNVHNIVRRNHEIHATIEVRPTNFKWLLSSIYASTSTVDRDVMWNNLKNLVDSHQDTWLVGGNFNDVFSSNDKLGRRALNSRRVFKLWDNINYCNLQDLGYKGSKYTWSNRRFGNNGLIMERLDNVFGNNEWIQCFPNASITHLPKTHSDHNSLLINLIPKKSHLFDKLFRLELYWCKHPHFKAIVSST